MFTVCFQSLPMLHTKLRSFSSIVLKYVIKKYDNMEFSAERTIL
jgi:hypothetical protein